MLSVDLFVTFVLALPVGAIVLGVWYGIRWRGRWRAAALVPVVLLLAWMAAVALRWPSEHTLWPFELLLYGPVALAYILILRYHPDATRSRGRGSVE